MKAVKLKAWGIFALVFLMMIIPAVLGILVGGQAYSPLAGGEKGIEIKNTVEVYMTVGGEKKRVSFEDYVIMAMLAEVPASFDKEALKAMAVAVRSYTARRVLTEEKLVCHFSADVCDDHTHCLGAVAYGDAALMWGEERADVFYKLIEEAVSETRGQVLCYEGMIADAVFHSSSCGYTESAENVWGFDIPYLVSAETFENAEKSIFEFSPDEFSEKLKGEMYLGDLSGEPAGWIEAVHKNETGRVSGAVVGGKTLTGRRIREIFGLPSACFDLVYNGEGFIFEVYGNGHGVGMSQYGCQSLAESGMLYGDILSHYYKGTYIEKLEYVK